MEAKKVNDSGNTDDSAKNECAPKESVVKEWGEEETMQMKCASEESVTKECAEMETVQQYSAEKESALKVTNMNEKILIELDDEEFLNFPVTADEIKQNAPETTPSALQCNLMNADASNPTNDSPNSLVAIRYHNEFEKLLMTLGEEGDGDSNQIIMELLNPKKQGDKYSVIERVSENLMHVLHSQTLSEAGIIPGNERYHCFKAVIQNYAKLYAAKKFLERLGSQDVSPESIKRGDEQQVLARIVAVEVLHMPALLCQLKVSLEKMDFFNEDTAFIAFLEARQYPQATILRDLMLTRISRVFLCIVSSSTFLDFTSHELVHMLKNCYLSVNSEIEILLSVVLWLEHNWYERKNYAEDVLSGVRFSLLPTWYLSTLERTNRSSHFGRVISMTSVQAMLRQGLEDAVVLRGSICTDGAASKVEQPLPRDWIADPECPHHHKCQCDRFVYPTFDVFKQYLRRIIHCDPNYWLTLRPAEQVYRTVLKCCTPKNLY